MVKFREASSNGGWLLNTELLQNNRSNLMLSNNSYKYNIYDLYFLIKKSYEIAHLF